MKKTIYSLLLSVMSIACLGQTGTGQKITIHGTVTGDTQGFNKIYTGQGNGAQDSIEIKNGKFTLVIPFTAPFSQFFYTEYEVSGERRSRGYRPTFLLFDRPGNVDINIDIEQGFSKANVQGSKSTTLFNEFLAQQTEINQAVREYIEKRFGKSTMEGVQPSGTAPGAGASSSAQASVAPAKASSAASVAPSKPGKQAEDPITAAGDSLFSKYMTSMITEFVQTNPDEYTSAYIVDKYVKSSVSVEQLQKIFTLLSPRMQQSQEGLNIKNYINGVKTTIVGSTVKSFSLPDPNGKIFNFEQLKGKYVWIDFWASWCGPCKAAFPHMQEFYAKYKSKNLEILGISTDQTKAPWINALKQFKNPWIQVLDDKSIVSSQFAVTALPTSILIGPDGKIIIREIGFNPNGELAKKLEEIFGK